MKLGLAEQENAYNVEKNADIGEKHAYKGKKSRVIGEEKQKVKKITLIERLQEQKKKLENIMARPRKEKTDELIIVRHQQGRIQFYRKDQEGEHYMRKAKDERKIRELAQIRYEIALLRAAEDEMAGLNKCLKILENCKDADKVFDEMPDELKPYITADIMTDKGYAQKWQREKVVTARPLKDGEGYKTLRGEYVRSKSEVIIADRLYVKGIPYRYEIYFPMEFEDINYVYPDFEILNVRTQEEFLWEHMGKLGDESYSETQMKKIAGYARSGFIPGKNLLLSFESKNRPLDTYYVDAMIDAFLV